VNSVLYSTLRTESQAEEGQISTMPNTMRAVHRKQRTLLRLLRKLESLTIPSHNAGKTSPITYTAQSNHSQIIHS
jgi:hypothetical protein